MSFLLFKYSPNTESFQLFVRVYMDDAMGERIWVDHPDCKGFVENIQTAFNTKPPPACQGLYPKPGL